MGALARRKRTAAEAERLRRENAALKATIRKLRAAATAARDESDQ